MDLARGDLVWRMAVPDSGVLPMDGVAPALITWQGSAHPAPRLTDRGVRLNRLIVSHPDILSLPVLGDPRVEYQLGARGISAEFDTPNGVVTL